MQLIEGVHTKKLRLIPDERGRLMEVIRSDDQLFLEFGQVYITTAYPGVVKAWHCHKKQSDSISCVSGMVKLVLYDDRNDSPTKGIINELFIGELNPCLVRIPPLVWHGFKCISEKEAVVINVPDQLYDYQNPDEMRVSPHGGNIAYDWGRKDG